MYSLVANESLKVNLSSSLLLMSFFLLASEELSILLVGELQMPALPKVLAAMRNCFGTYEPLTDQLITNEPFR